MRTEFLTALISVFETHSSSWQRFKVYLAQSLMIKSAFTLKNLNLHSLEAKRKSSSLLESAPVEQTVQEEEQKVMVIPVAAASGEQASLNFFEDDYKKSANSIEEIEKRNNQLRADLTKVDKRFVELVLENIYLNCVRVSIDYL